MKAPTWFVKALHRLDPQLRVEWDGFAKRWAIWREVGGRCDPEQAKDFPPLEMHPVGEFAGHGLYLAQIPRVWVGYVQRGGLAGGPFADLSSGVIEALRRRSTLHLTEKEVLAQAKADVQVRAAESERWSEDFKAMGQEIGQTVAGMLNPRVDLGAHHDAC